ncbi:IclR family transcriptional regulator [Lacisediminihabitans profunda]|uniref:Helix-turn-helix domain-containing protein n=1 Tax=Lacisediminihabitans profunda TaxID=2594790 RepID=A0A5C8UQ18_9MICO|nr:helix-turn-helix domain-containing protein [Lacisediminihabitans profunda]TXN29994.1 helix-turn-helix domain-containing protein [Lacisediminihabitans profunda]
MTGESVDEAASGDIQAVARVGQIFSLFSPAVTELTAGEVADLLGLNRTTAYRYCTSLVTAGFLERGGRRGSFVLGGLMLQLGILALGRRRIVELAPPHLARLSDRAHTTALLSLWGAQGPVVTRVEENSDRKVLVTVRVGVQLDLSAAQMKVFLAWHPDRFAVERIIGQLAAGERAALEQTFEEIRRTGICIVDEIDGLVGAAAPVFDEYGICATVALLGTDRMSDFSPGSLAMNELMATAAALSDEVGGTERRMTKGRYATR